jgi:hypothetical protein
MTKAAINGIFTGILVANFANLNTDLLCTFFLLFFGQLSFPGMVRPGNTKGESITVPLTSFLTGLD